MLRISRIPHVVKAAALAVASLSLLAPSAAAIVPGGIAANVVVYNTTKHTSTYSGIDYGSSNAKSDDRYTRTSWRLVDKTGNCCENYLTISPKGRLLDFGGTYVTYTDDRGKTWRQVQPQIPLKNGEGAIVMGLNGDILAVGWDPYTGDHLQSFKYDAVRTQWVWSEMPLKTPFYDREWIGVVPGPITINGTTYPYVSFVKGGFPFKEAWLYSTDGTTYTDITSKYADSLKGNPPTKGPLPTVANPRNDWIQPNTNSGMTSLGGNKMLASGDSLGGWALFDGSNFSWSDYSFPDGSEPQGRFQVDSAGRIHNVIPSGDGASFVYRISADGGRTWKSATAQLPENQRFDQWDFRANKAVGIGAVAVHTLNQATDTNQDMVFKFNIMTNQPFLKQRLLVGKGDQGSAAGVENDVRLDFQTVVIFPDGRVALSMLDSTTGERPVLAIEQDTTLGGRVQYTTAPSPVLGTPYATYHFDAGDEGWTTDTPGWTRSTPGEAGGKDSATGASWAIEGPTQYIDSLDASLTSPAIRTDAGWSVVQFWLKGQLEEGFDYVTAEWSANGTSWLPLTSFTGRSAGYPDWTKLTAGFNSPGGNIQVRFQFESDTLCSALDSVQCGSPATGVRVDEVIVGKQKR